MTVLFRGLKKYRYGLDAYDFRAMTIRKEWTKVGSFITSHVAH